MDLPISILRKSWFLTGPTASGKSSTALILARRLDAEIISLDSMAIYRGMDIGTAKPSTDDREQVQHHLLDVADPSEEFSVAEFVQLAANAAIKIDQKGKIPLFAGGTGLYLRSLLRGIFDGPDADWELRQHWEHQARENGPQWLHDQLSARDPKTAARLHLNDMRRIIRAIEVFESTGQPLSEGHEHGPRPPEDRPQSVVWLEPPRPWLRDRIDQRVDAMMQAGWLEEARWLMKLDPPASKTACQAIGYRELISHLKNPTSLDSTIDLIKISTRQFAKRQHTWFRNLEECQALAITGDESPERLADRILQLADSNTSSDKIHASP